MFGVEADSFLPNRQCDGRDLARQGQPCHVWPDPFRQQSGVKLLQWTWFGRRIGGRTLEQVLEIVIVVTIEPTNRYLLLRSSQLSIDEAVFCTVVGFDAEAAVGPQLSLSAEPMRGLQDGNQQGSPNRTDRWNLAEPLGCPVVGALRQQIPAYFSAQR